ncbi:MAG: replication restart helicase PriA [Prevotella sp.]|jgi:primosomal protein N' (replication factor Y)
MKYVDVLLPLALEAPLTYSITDEMALHCSMGVRVLVPLGKSKTYAALVLRLHEDKPDLSDDKIKSVLSVLDNSPMLLPAQLRLWQWIADYYLCTVGEVFKAAMPSGLKAESGFRPKTESYVALAPKYRSAQALHLVLDLLRRATKQAEILTCYLHLSHWDRFWSSNNDSPAAGESALVSASPDLSSEKLDDEYADPRIFPDSIREVTREELLNVSHGMSGVLQQLERKGILKVYDKEVGRLNDAGEPHPENIKKLDVPQADAYNKVLMQWMKHPVVLLHGVTSSGKTEIYIHLIQKTIDEGKQVLYLLPEIALTVQITQRLQRVFGRRLGIYHSKYSDAERVEIWQKQLSATPYDIILGARSAVFLPFQRLGLVIVDEEHETSYKQQEPAPRYHARSTAIVLAQMLGAKTLLGTATPSAESFYNAQNGKYGLVELTTRYKGIELPEIQVVDIKDLRHRKMMSGPFSPDLLAAIRDALAHRQQAIIFQNRRGFAPMMQCRVCGWVPKCRNCDVSLSYHKRLNLLTCHICGFTMPVPDHCPCCDSTSIADRGFGTEKIEDEMALNFPKARIARMDLDTTRTRNAQERIINDFSHGKTDILIGTQMISKGLDFDRVAIVGILDADSMLNYPDFRAYEHAFMMMAQVAGRAGRHGQRGRVILQTRSPQLPVIGQVVNNDFKGFFKDLLEERRLFHYPPFTRLIYVYLRHKSDSLVEMAAQDMGGRLRHIFGERVLGPDKPAIARAKQLCIRKLVLKLELSANLRQVRQQLKDVRARMNSEKAYAAIQIVFDMDPE